MSKVAQMTFAAQRAYAHVNANANVHTALDAFNAFVYRGSIRAPLESLKRDCLRGWKVAVKDNIAVETWPMTCASKSLHNFTAPYSAEVVSRLLACGAECIGKTNMDEFGMG
jgi:aspartyl-tRNA(Asn)/glutamyl-tRNA(Gln) amidotransferase subunit A